MLNFHLVIEIIELGCLTELFISNKQPNSILLSYSNQVENNNA